MHEVSLVRTIFRTLEDNFTPEELSTVTAIDLKIGPLANVEPILMRNAFSAVVAEDEVRFKDVALNFNLVPIIVHCAACNQDTEIHNYRFVCACGQPCGNVVQGNEILIERVHFMEN